MSSDRPSRWAILPALLAGTLTLWVLYVLRFLFPVVWEWRITSFLAVLLSGGVAAAGICPWRRFHVRGWTTLAVLAGLVITEVSWMFARDGYIFVSPEQRAAGLTAAAVQRKPTDAAAAKRIFKKAVYAATQMTTDNQMVLVAIAEEQVKAGFFGDAESTILLIEDPIQWDLYYGVIATEMAKHGGRSQGQRLFEQAIRSAQQDPDASRRDRDLYLIGYRQWEGGMYEEARRTAALIQTADLKADLLNRLNDSFQLERARQQAAAGQFAEAEAAITQNVKDPYRYCDGLISVATTAATNAQPDHARRIFDHALKAAQQLESPMGGNSVIADIAVRQLELGLQAESQRTLAMVTHAGVKDELVKKLARVKPASAKL